MAKTHTVATVTLIVALTVPAQGGSSCHTMQVLAQEHANSMARRDRLDHAGFARRAA